MGVVREEPTAPTRTGIMSESPPCTRVEMSRSFPDFVR